MKLPCELHETRVETETPQALTAEEMKLVSGGVSPQPIPVLIR